MSNSRDTAATSHGSRRFLIPLATMVAAAAVVAASGASFTSTTSSAPNVVTAGAFTQTNTKDGAAIFTMPLAKPGDSVTGTATVTNTGDFAADFTLVEEGDSNGFPIGALDLVVTDTTDALEPVTVYSGDLGLLGSQSLGTVAPDGVKTYSFVVTLDANVGNEAQGDTATATYTWDAIQSS